MENPGQSILEINLLNLRKNFLKLSEMIAKEVKIAPVVKANAYGLGLSPIAQTFADVGAEEFCVAYVSEGLELRNVISQKHIYLFNGLNHDELADIYQYNLIPVLNDLEQIEIWSKFANLKNKKLPCVINLETGMCRLGLQKNDFQKFLDGNYKHSLDIKYLMSHLANADLPESEENNKQLIKLREFSKLMPATKVSFANSAGIFLGKEYHFDQIRTGCALYGIKPSHNVACDIKTVVTLHGKVLQIKHLETDQGISYHCLHRAKKGDVIATVLCGYADGYLRSLSGNSYVYYDGMRLKVVGNVTMDMIMVDVSAVPQQKLEKMKYVELLGDNITVNELADRANTIGYEIFTSLGDRFNRIYKNDD